MKKLLLLLSVAGMVFFASCEKEPEEDTISSLAGTTWKHRMDYDGNWTEFTLSFTSTHATYTHINSANNNSNFTGTYTYDPPEVIVSSNNWTLTGNPPTGTFIFPYEIDHIGTVNGETMTIDIEFHDEIATVELQKQ